MIYVCWTPRILPTQIWLTSWEHTIRGAKSSLNYSKRKWRVEIESSTCQSRRTLFHSSNRNKHRLSQNRESIRKITNCYLVSSYPARQKSMICTCFFQYENQSSPASLSDDGILHSCPKSQLVDILESLVTMPDTEPEADIAIIDSTAFCNILPTRASKTFDDCIRQDLIPKVEFYGNKF